MKVFITGASGFVGSTLCDELTKQGHEVFALMRKSSKRGHLTNAKYTPVAGDLRDRASLVEAVNDAEVILHVAGVIAARSREEFFASNVDGTRNVAEAAIAGTKNLKRFVYVSSLAAAGPAERGGIRQESEGEHPVSWYGESKLGGELALRELGAKLPSVVVRPPAVYGPRDSGIFTFFETVNRGILPALGMENPDPRRYSFVHVEDLVQGILAAAFLPKQFSPAEVFYICGDEVSSWEDAMRGIAKALEKKTIRVPLPLAVMKGAAALCSAYTKVTGNLLPLSLDKIKELEAYAWTCSSQKAKKELGFTPYWGLEKGFRQTALWYRENGWLK